MMAEIAITEKSLKRHVKVMVPMIKPNGSLVWVPSNMVRDYKALGLSVRRKV